VPKRRVPKHIGSASQGLKESIGLLPTVGDSTFVPFQHIPVILLLLLPSFIRSSDIGHRERRSRRAPPSFQGLYPCNVPSKLDTFHPVIPPTPFRAGTSKDCTAPPVIASTRQKNPYACKLSPTTTMSFDSRIHENFLIRFSISSPLGDPLGKLNKFSYLLDATHLLALSIPSDDEPLQCTIADDYIEVIQDLIVYPLLEQEFMSTMGPSNRAQRIQALAESPFTLLAKAEAVTSAATLLEAIQDFCAWATCPAAVNVYNILTGNTGPPIMELELQFTHWHFTPTWNGRHLDGIIPHSDYLASCLEPSPTVEPSAHPLDEGKDASPVLNSPLECLAPNPSSSDVPTSTVDPVTSPTVSNLDQGKATPPTASCSVCVC